LAALWLQLGNCDIDFFSHSSLLLDYDSENTEIQKSEILLYNLELFKSEKLLKLLKWDEIIVHLEKSFVTQLPKVRETDERL